jgi:hypothetical protein
MPWTPIVLAGAALIAGVVVTITMATLLGPLLIVGGVAGLGVGVLPEALAATSRLLSVGFSRRPPR